MAVGNVKGFRVKKGGETGIAKIATEAILDEAVTKAKLAQAVQDEVDKVKDKADANGDYDDLTVGSAKALLSTVYVEDKVPYNFRTSGGTADIGDRMYDEVVGGTVVWNQHYTPSTNPTQTSNGVTATKNADGYSWTVNGTSTAVGSVQIGGVSKSAGSLIANHIYYCNLGAKGGSYATYWGGIAGLSIDIGNGGLYKHTYTFDSSGIRLDFRYADITFDNLVLIPQWIDLTQMFGSTIADYIYSLEQGTAGAGVAWFRKLFPKPYYAYNAGELMSVKAGSHDTVGFNAWDEEWEQGGFWSGGQLRDDKNAIRSKNFIPVVPNTTYYFTADSGSSFSEKSAAYIFLYDAEKNLVHRYENIRQFSTTSDCSYIKFDVKDTYGTTYKNDICINLAWDGERNGEYEPYEKHEYPLAELELRGIPKLDANNQLYYDGDTYASDGTVTRKYGIVDLGTVNWNADDNTAVSVKKRFYAHLSGKGIVLAMSDTTNGARSVCSGFTLLEQGTTYNCTNDGYTIASNGAIYVYLEAFADKTADQLKTAMNGVYLVYELATPTTETADTFTNPQVVDDFGTEEYTDYAVEAGDRDVAIPVGHNSQYMNNLRAKLEMAPDSPSGDGKYIVQQSNRQNAYIPYTADGRLDTLEAKLPTPPSENGTYKLTATVTDGSVTYTWTAG